MEEMFLTAKIVPTLGSQCVQSGWGSRQSRAIISKKMRGPSGVVKSSTVEARVVEGACCLELLPEQSMVLVRNPIEIRYDLLVYSHIWMGEQE